MIEPVGEEREILDVKLTMDGKDTLIRVFCSHGKSHQRSLGNVVGARERIRQCQEKTGILRKDSQLNIVREVTLVLHGVIGLLVREGSVGAVRVRVEKGLEVVDGLHVRHAHMVGATAGSDDQCDLVGRGGLAGHKMHNGRCEGAMLRRRPSISIFNGFIVLYTSPCFKRTPISCS